MFTSPLAKIAPPSLAAALSLNVALVIFDLELKENRVFDYIIDNNGTLDIIDIVKTKNIILNK